MDPIFSEYQKKIEECIRSNSFPKDIADNVISFTYMYANAAKANGVSFSSLYPLLVKLLDLVIDQIKNPYIFEPYHKAVRKPFDFYRFGVDFIRPLVILEKSTIRHEERLREIESYISHGENVVLLSNHQTEADPQLISVLLEKTYPKIAEEMIFVAGHRVVNDPLAVPFSKGRNLICIYSKKYIEDHPEQKMERLTHNQKTMMKMSELLTEGGKCIYVAPSGGRDRRNKQGIVDVAPFDPQSIEMFYLMSQRAGTATHFYPFALSTYDLLPPPDEVLKQLGEPRHTSATPIHLAFGNEINMEHSLEEAANKQAKRKMRAHNIWETVRKEYQSINKR